MNISKEDRAISGPVLSIIHYRFGYALCLTTILRRPTTCCWSTQSNRLAFNQLKAKVRRDFKLELNIGRSV